MAIFSYFWLYWLFLAIFGYFLAILAIFRSVIVPVSETVVTRAWLENAIRVFEDEAEIILVTMRFDRDKDGSYEAYVTAQVGPNQVQKSYEWIIKEAPEKKVFLNLLVKSQS